MQKKKKGKIRALYTQLSGTQVSSFYPGDRVINASIILRLKIKSIYIIVSPSNIQINFFNAQITCSSNILANLAQLTS